MSSATAAASIAVNNSAKLKNAIKNATNLTKVNVAGKSYVVAQIPSNSSSQSGEPVMEPAASSAAASKPLSANNAHPVNGVEITEETMGGRRKSYHRKSHCRKSRRHNRRNKSHRRNRCKSRHN